MKEALQNLKTHVAQLELSLASAEKQMEAFNAMQAKREKARAEPVPRAAWVEGPGWAVVRAHPFEVMPGELPLVLLGYFPRESRALAFAMMLRQEEAENDTFDAGKPAPEHTYDRLPFLCKACLDSTSNGIEIGRPYVMRVEDVLPEHVPEVRKRYVVVTTSEHPKLRSFFVTGFEWEVRLRAIDEIERLSERGDAAYPIGVGISLHPITGLVFRFTVVISAKEHRHIPEMNRYAYQGTYSRLDLSCFIGEGELPSAGGATESTPNPVERDIESELARAILGSLDNVRAKAKARTVAGVKKSERGTLNLTKEISDEALRKLRRAQKSKRRKR